MAVDLSYLVIIRLHSVDNLDDMTTSFIQFLQIWYLLP